MSEAKGFKCECGKWHAFPAYVFGHWYEELIHTCQECKARHCILEGNATPIGSLPEAMRRVRKGSKYAPTDGSQSGVK